MAAPVLSVLEQKKSLSSKKKKTVKNVLGLPASVKVKSIEVSAKEREKLIAILERLLPAAKIPVLVHEDLEKNQESNKNNLQNAEAVKLAKSNRAQLALGINELNRTVKKNQVSAALLASDIHPKFLIHHLNLLCMHNKIPFLHVPELRKLTQNCLGFPCIALGFKKNYENFKEVIKEIQLVAQKTNIKLETLNLREYESESSNSDEEESIENSNHLENDANNDKTFTYLYRSSIKERVFSPENVNFAKQEAVEFISVEESVDNKNAAEENNIPKAISANQIKKKKLFKINKCESPQDDNEQYEVPKKKKKPGSTVDKVGDNKNYKYSSTNIIKMYPNENRAKKRQKFSK